MGSHISIATMPQGGRQAVDKIDEFVNNIGRRIGCKESTQLRGGRRETARRDGVCRARTYSWNVGLLVGRVKDTGQKRTQMLPALRQTVGIPIAIYGASTLAQ